MSTATFHAEWTKVRTLRSTWATVLGASALSLLFAFIVSTTQANDWDEMTPTEQAEFDPTSAALVGVLFTTVIFGSFAVRTIAGEHATGMIRTTFAALPNRRHVVLTKAAIVAGLALPTTLAANLAAFLLGQRILSSTGAETTLGAPGVVRAITFGALAVSATAVLGVGLGGIIRRTAAATTLLSVAIIGSQLFSVVVPTGARPYLPGTALQAAVTGTRTDDLLAPVPAMVTLGAYALAALAAAMVLVERRDA
jgi:ABC-2 type transport system permease protein